MVAPPKVLDHMRIVAYAFVDESVEWTARKVAFIGETKIGPQARLAIGRDLGMRSTAASLFHCDDAWNVVWADEVLSVDEAKSKAENYYRGIASKWTDVPIAEPLQSLQFAPQTERFECGRVYFSFMFADRRMSLPVIESLQYVGAEDGMYSFLILGTNDQLCRSSADLEDLLDATALAAKVTEWSSAHPHYT